MSSASQSNKFVNLEHYESSINKLRSDNNPESLQYYSNAINGSVARDRTVSNDEANDVT